MTEPRSIHQTKNIYFLFLMNASVGVEDQQTTE